MPTLGTVTQRVTYVHTKRTYSCARDEESKVSVLDETEEIWAPSSSEGGGTYPGREVPYLWVCLYYQTRQNRVTCLVIRRLVELKDLDEV